ncbi:hypothetical protein C0995_004959 [Termitomyces sp. Mi166|nr:hypothetical protein C0995_004959 [Termitomyces sp. Mi166\
MPPRAAASPTLINDQIEHSSYMRLLAALRFRHPPSKISNASNRDPAINSDMRHLETIAACMVTGNKGNVVASAFWRKPNKSITIVLARNDAATLDDTSHAKEFLAKLKDSQDFRDLVPFLIKRCGMENFQKIVKKLEDLTGYPNDHDMFITVVKKYCEREDVDIRNLSLELPKRGQDLLTLWRSKSIKLSNLNLQQALENIIDILTPRINTAQRL